MDDPAVVVRHVGKTYRLGGGRPAGGYRTLREELLQLPNRRRAARRSQSASGFVALDDLSFTVERGETFGIIGRNGAGKSTLLKILGRITEPTKGEVDLFGRVGSLLEVGAGFHSELTGRENIFLSGAILGLRRAEVRRRLDEIVAFAEVERFIDTPCKHYSSGMYMRLAFAVAAHLEAEILLVDEVLAVGDAAFQRKCLGKMGEVAGAGRTVVFVSHNMAAVRQLCSRGLVLERGRAAFIGEIERAVESYQQLFVAAGVHQYVGPIEGERPAWIARAMLRTADGAETGTCLMSEAVTIELEIIAREARRLACSVQVRDSGQMPLFHFPSVDVGAIIPEARGRHRLSVHLPPLLLYPGAYGLRLTLTEAGGGGFSTLDVVEVLTLTVEQDAALCTRPLHRQAGLIFARADWRLLETSRCQ